MSMKMAERLFPRLTNSVGDWCEIEANSLAKEAIEIFGFGLEEEGENPFLDPNYVAKWMAFVAKVLDVKYTYGGYMEDRSILWHGHYMQPDSMIHLGVDFNVPAGTDVFMPDAGELVYSLQDTDQNGGWGGKLIFKPLREEKPFIIFGHLKDMVTEKQIYERGDRIGVVAEADCNGGWYPHLHVQCMREFQPDIDGYGKLYNGMLKDFPHPEKYLVR
mgnify:CR=1 FL=1